MAENTNTSEAPKKPAKKQPISLVEGIKLCSTLLVQSPDALEFHVQMTEGGRHYYAFDDATQDASDVRHEIAIVLKEVYDNGAYSYGEFARKLRVDALSIQALLDEDFRDQHNLA